MRSAIRTTTWFCMTKMPHCQPVTGRIVFDIEQYSGIEPGMLFLHFGYVDCLALPFLS
jgi:hypothetical protein